MVGLDGGLGYALLRMPGCGMLVLPGRLTPALDDIRVPLRGAR
jgi:hypothetical protein